MSGPGTVVVSVDAELGWGFHHLDDPPFDRIRTARTAWHTLLELFDEYRVPATWAVVGHLLLESCREAHVGHPAGERCCEVGGDGLPAEDVWFGRGLVDAVGDADVDHEVASHGFTHLHFRHDRMTRRLADAELAASRAAAARRGLAPRSFVFPVNRPNYRELLADHGFECYRGPDPAAGAASGRLRKLQSVLGLGAPPIVRPSVDEHGLVNVPGSLYLFSFDGVARTLVEPATGDPIVGAVRRGLDRLAGDDGVLHLWLHPHNLQTAADVERMRGVLDAVQRRRARGEVRVETMDAVAERLRATPT